MYSDDFMADAAGDEAGGLNGVEPVHVLLCDAEENSRAVVASLLRKCGYEARAAAGACAPRREETLAPRGRTARCATPRHAQNVECRTRKEAAPNSRPLPARTQCTTAASGAEALQLLRQGLGIRMLLLARAAGFPRPRRDAGGRPAWHREVPPPWGPTAC